MVNEFLVNQGEFPSLCNLPRMIHVKQGDFPRMFT